MDIILKGQHDAQELVDSITNVLKHFKERYKIDAFCEIHLTVTLVDEQGDIVELMDSESEKSYRFFEVHRSGYELAGKQGLPMLQLVVDNTR